PYLPVGQPARGRYARARLAPAHAQVARLVGVPERTPTGAQDHRVALAHLAAGLLLGALQVGDGHLVAGLEGPAEEAVEVEQHPAPYDRTHLVHPRSEERRVGKEARSRLWTACLR